MKITKEKTTRRYKPYPKPRPTLKKTFTDGFDRSISKSEICLKPMDYAFKAIEPIDKRSSIAGELLGLAVGTIGFIVLVPPVCVAAFGYAAIRVIEEVFVRNT